MVKLKINKTLTKTNNKSTKIKTKIIESEIPITMRTIMLFWG